MIDLSLRTNVTVDCSFHILLLKPTCFVAYIAIALIIITTKHVCSDGTNDLSSDFRPNLRPYQTIPARNEAFNYLCSTAAGLFRPPLPFFKALKLFDSLFFYPITLVH